MNHALKKAFEETKYAGGVVKDTLLNAGNSLLAGQASTGAGYAGIGIDNSAVLADARASNKARREARALSKKQNPYLQ